MNRIKKEQITNLLLEYCERYESQSKAAKSLKDVSGATVSQMINKNWDLISDVMWRNVAKQIGYREHAWERRLDKRLSCTCCIIACNDCICCCIQDGS